MCLHSCFWSVQFATVYVNNGEKYHGGKGTLNVWNPKVDQGIGFSSSSVSIINEPDDRNDTANIIEAGWRVIFSSFFKKITQQRKQK